MMLSTNMGSHRSPPTIGIEKISEDNIIVTYIRTFNTFKIDFNTSE